MIFLHRMFQKYTYLHFYIFVCYIYLQKLKQLLKTPR